MKLLQEYHSRARGINLVIALPIVVLPYIIRLLTYLNYRYSLLRHAVFTKFQRLVSVHREDCPEFVIPMFVFKEKVKNMPGGMDEHDEFMMMRYNDHNENGINFQL